MPWETLVALGAFHGVNPAMGWLFAVAIGLQERSRAALLRALLPIAAGHELSVALVAVVVEVSSAAAQRVVVLVGAAVLVGFGLWRLISKRHFKWVGMRLNLWELAGWSFLMSTAHGAGLMLVPVLLRSGGGAGTGGSAGAGAESDHVHGLADLLGSGDLGRSVLHGLGAAGIHSLSMLVVMATIAVGVYEVLGLEFLRRAWFNIDRVWAVALIGAGVATLFT